MALGHVQFGPGDEMTMALTEAAGLFLLDIETCGVEGWTWASPPLPSPGNRFVHFPSDQRPLLYDRLTGRTFTWDPTELFLVRERDVPWDDTPSLLGWGQGAGERLVFGAGSRYAVVDGSMQAVASFELDGDARPFAWWPHPDGTHVLARSAGADSGVDTLHAVDLSGGAPATADAPRTRPPDFFDASPIRIFSGGEGLAVVSWDWDDSCTIRRHDWDLTRLSEVLVPCSGFEIDLSPDGRWAAVSRFSVGEQFSAPGTVSRLAAVSIFDVATGEEFLRLQGAVPSHDTFRIHQERSRWLADSSGVVVRTSTGTRVAGVDGLTIAASGWAGPLVPSRTAPELMDRPDSWGGISGCAPTAGGESRHELCRVVRATVVDLDGGERAAARLTLQVAEGSAWDASGPAFERTSWGAAGDDLRIHLVLGGPLEGGDVVPLLPPVVARPPFAGLITLVVDTGAICEHLRDAPDGEGTSLACLSAGTFVESVTPPDETYYRPWETTGHVVGGMVHVRTADGVQGWMGLRGLAWAP